MEDNGKIDNLWTAHPIGQSVHDTTAVAGRVYGPLDNCNMRPGVPKEPRGLAEYCADTNIKVPKPNYKFNEDLIFEEVRRYVFSTYDAHYAKTKIQSLEAIVDAGYGEGFCIGNIMKLAQRYGKKSGRNRLDLLKIAHYAMLMLYIQEEQEREAKTPGLATPFCKTHQRQD